MKLSTWFKDESGQAMSEYGLIIALIAVVAIGVIAVFGRKIAAAFNTAQQALP
jgi:Flp pilus assembly pilin Flp